MTDISIDYRPTLDRYIKRLSSDYRPSVDRPSTECRPITDRYIGQVSTNYWQSVGKVSVNEKLYRPRHIWNDYRPCLDRVSTDYRPLYRPTGLSTECRPSIDRLSTECRPTIDRVSTAISTAISTDISVDITHSKQDPGHLQWRTKIKELWTVRKSPSKKLLRRTLLLMTIF